MFESQNMINKNGPTYLHEMLNYKRHAYNTRNDLLDVPIGCTPKHMVMTLSNIRRCNCGILLVMTNSPHSP